MAAVCVALLAMLLVAPAFAEPAPPGEGRLAMTLAPPLLEGDVNLFDLTPDGTRAIVSTGTLGREQQIFAVRLDGATPPQLLVASGNSNLLLLAVSDERLLFASYEAGASRTFALVVRSALLDGSAPPTQLDRVDAIRRFGSAALTSGGRLVYNLSAERGDGVVQQLRSVPADGSGPVALLFFVRAGIAGPFWTLGGAARDQIVYAQVGQADSGRRLTTGLTFSSYQFVGTTRLLVGGDSVALVALDGATPPTLLVSAVGRIFDTAVADDRMLYTACSGDCDDGVSLLSVPLTGPEGAAVRLATWYRESFVEFRATPDGRVVYIADQDDRPGSELYSVPIAPVGASFAAGGLAVAEGGNVELELRLGSALSAPAAIGYRVFGAGLDRRGLLRFALGATAQTISLDLPADPGFTGDRQLLVELREPVGLAPGFFDRVVVTVRDSEARRVWLPSVRRPLR